MRRHLSTVLIALLFLAGLSVALYPTVSDYVNSKSQSKAVATYLERMEQLDDSQIESLLAEARAYNESVRTRPDRFQPEDGELEAYMRLLGSDGGAVGYMEIESIGVSLPIYMGDDEAALQVGVGTMPGSSLPIGGAGTHSVLMAHRGLPTSRLFTDLDQVEQGDTFVLHVLGQTLTYEVDQILVVEPDEISELDIQPDRDLCTLVTCTPYGINSHRMLVRGSRIANAPESTGDGHAPSAGPSRSVFPIVLLVAVPAAIAALVVIKRKRGQGRFSH